MTTLEVILSTATGLLGTGGVIAWLRGAFSGKDKADRYKTSAETENELAEAQERRANAETKIADAALEWAQKLSVELDKLRVSYDLQKTELNDVWHKLQAAQTEAGTLNIRVQNIQTTLEYERNNCKKIQEELVELKKSIQK